jgi:uncharacterized protein
MLRTLIALLVALSSFAPAQTAAKPKIRAITGFVVIDREHYKTQMGEALKVLRDARSEYEKAGYEVQSIRITTEPFPQYTRGLSHDEALNFLLELDAFVIQEKVDLNIGPAVTTATDDLANVELLSHFLAKSKGTNASAIVADESGINWAAVRASAKLVKYLQINSPRSQGTFAFAATAMLKPGTPFYPGSWHNGKGKQFAVGMQSANVVGEVFAQTGYDPQAASAKLKMRIAEITTPVEKIALGVAKQSGWEYLGIDATPAPLMDDSIGAAIENFTGKRLGSSGTMTATAIITEAVKSAPVKLTGYNGLMLPVLEDKRIAQRWTEGALTLDMLLAYSSVCATGVDTVPLPGDITEDQVARIIGDVATLAFKWKKPLTARLQPVNGRTAGEMSDFDDPFLTNAKLQPLP